MPVTLLRGENLRLYPQFRIEPNPSLNLIIGANAAGKTSLLEALFTGARGRSFRAASLAEVCGARGQGWHVFMETMEADDHHRIGLGWSREGVRLHLDEDRHARVEDVVRAVPMQLIDPLAHRLLDEGPTYRRSFVDWGVFHVEHRFLDCWRRYQRSLRQRNRALREKAPARAVRAWDEELSHSGEELNRMRQSHLEASSEGLKNWCQRLLDTEAVRCEWQRGWPADGSLHQTLERNLEQHQRLGTTVQGPHRAEMRITLAQSRAKGRVSRGQQKLLIAAMVLAQSEVLAASSATWPILLLDDFASELAADFQQRLAWALQQYPGQKFITAFEVPSAFRSGSPMEVFHVEHGIVSASPHLH